MAHILWLMKSIVAQAIMNTTCFIKFDPCFQEIQKKIQLVQFLIQQNNVHLGHIEKRIPCLR